MHSIRQILQIKGNKTWSISPHATAYEALKLMSDKDIGALLVMQGQQLVGIFSERDYARKVILKGRSSRATLVSEIMTRDVHCLESHATVDDGMAMMTNKRVRHIPIVDAGTIVGIISIGDLVKQLISDQEVIIDKMEKYIRGELA